MRYLLRKIDQQKQGAAPPVARAAAPRPATVVPLAARS
jgi:hypothetical protein